MDANRMTNGSTYRRNEFRELAPRRRSAAEAVRRESELPPTTFATASRGTAQMAILARLSRHEATTAELHEAGICASYKALGVCLNTMCKKGTIVRVGKARYALPPVPAPPPRETMDPAPAPAPSTGEPPACQPAAPSTGEPPACQPAAPSTGEPPACQPAAPATAPMSEPVTIRPSLAAVPVRELALKQRTLRRLAVLMADDIAALLVEIAADLECTR